MALRVAVHHTTEYTFDRPVRLGPHVVRLRPAPHCRTPILAYSLKVEPRGGFLNWQQDPFGNFLARLVFPERSRKLSIEVELLAEMRVVNPFDFFLEPEAESFPFQYPAGLRRDLACFLEASENGSLLGDYVQGVDRSPRRTVDFLVEVNRRLARDIRYLVRMEPGVQSCEDTLRAGSGSCRDSAWLLVQVLRRSGIAARFVSGYIVQLVADVPPVEGPKGPPADFTDLHAWAEAFVPGAGWIGFDPTSGLLAGEGHLPLCCSPDPTGAAPVSGATEPCDVRLSFAMRLTRVHEEPRTTRPYTEQEWESIDDVGRMVDEALERRDVRLTLGGEPTFVSIDDMENAEWNTAADGPAKRRIAGELLVRLRDRFAPGGLLHFGQGKWYPGEPLPRWALGCYWRRDGVPIWRDPALAADEASPSHFGIDEASALARRIAERLAVDPAAILAGHEDVYYYLWREGTLPINVDPLAADLSDDLERARLRKLLERGLAVETGFALPLRWDASAGGWRTGPWRLRRERLYLVPGDSAMGYRLPLDSLPAGPPESQVAPCMFEPRGDLGDPAANVAARYAQWLSSSAGPGGATSFADDDRPGEGVRTALCVEPRGGRLYVFVPPLTHLEPYLDLISAIEQAAGDLGFPVRIEGYPPPVDWRLLKLSISPDPGVLEVNVQPAGNWTELCSIVEGLYDDARRCRLGAEKFMLDGRHTGTGGGNHITLGGPSPADSPFLRRPDLLQSLITYWQHHPSLSYFFSGLFVGPTSQAPRIDEARHESLYEMEIALAQTPSGESVFPWLVDRLYRNLLVDSTGNTHRAEICIDKLHAPEQLAGRLGLVELRSFEMPPHPRMSLVQSLLVRALVARFWRSPYRFPLVRWGTALHDRFLLPHYLWQDVGDVVEGLRAAGFPFEWEWLRPFLEFRFPKLGVVEIGDVSVELRVAAEPWHVLGEEATSLGTARFVDSSLERLQVFVRGMTEGRHVVVCNGRRVPLRSTGRNGEYVAGVRYRAWQPPSALHPMIGVHSPLVFDLVDLWNGRSLGGCTHHVAHPGGRNFTTYPVNAFEAESRRIARFWPHGHTPGPMAPLAEEPTREYPHTLDLRVGRFS